MHVAVTETERKARKSHAKYCNYDQPKEDGPAQHPRVVTVLTFTLGDLFQLDKKAPNGLCLPETKGRSYLKVCVFARQKEVFSAGHINQLHP